MSLANNPAERALELRDVSKFFGDLAALKRVGLRVAPGDCLLVYGPNGAGKTTLLRTLAGLARPTQGHVLFNGRLFHDDAAAGKTAIGFLSHATFLYGELTASENLRFAATLFGLEERERRIRSVLRLFGAEEDADRRVRELSRGYQQRVALARAFLHDPDYFLLDEPFTGLDRETAENLHGLLERLPREGKALVFSTHDFEQGASIARRLVVLEKGFLRYDGPIASAPLDALGIAPRADKLSHA